MSAAQDSGQFHRADPAYRRQMQLVLALVVLGGGAALVALQFWLQRLGASQGDLFSHARWLNRLLAGVGLLFGLVAAGFAHWLYQIARASNAERRWPPSSMRTSTDVRIRYLTSVDPLIAQLKGAALALAVFASLLVGWSSWLFWSS